MVLKQESCGFLPSHYRSRLQNVLQVRAAVLAKSGLIKGPKDVPVVVF